MALVQIVVKNSGSLFSFVIIQPLAKLISFPYLISTSLRMLY